MLLIIIIYLVFVLFSILIKVFCNSREVGWELGWKLMFEGVVLGLRKVGVVVVGFVKGIVFFEWVGEGLGVFILVR